MSNKGALTSSFMLSQRIVADNGGVDDAQSRSNEESGQVCSCRSSKALDLFLHHPHHCHHRCCHRCLLRSREFRPSSRSLPSRSIPPKDFPFPVSLSHRHLKQRRLTRRITPSRPSLSIEEKLIEPIAFSLHTPPFDDLFTSTFQSKSFNVHRKHETTTTAIPHDSDSLRLTITLFS